MNEVLTIKHKPKLTDESVELRNAQKNKMVDSDRSFHDWYRFILSYPPHLVSQYLTEFQLEPQDIVLDPFCGTGTTLVEAKRRGIRSIGMEANPFAQFVSQTKINWEVNAEQLLSTAIDIRDNVIEQLIAEGISDVVSFGNKLSRKYRRFTKEQKKLLLTDSISPLPTHKCLRLLDEITRYRDTPLYGNLAVALAKSAVFGFSNLRFGPEVGVGPIKKDASVIGPWFSEVVKHAQDLEEGYEYNTCADASVFLHDSRQMGTLLTPKSISAVITSPPYPNEKDYTRTTRLESVLLGFFSTKEGLRQSKKTLLRSNTRGIYKEDDDDQYICDFPVIQELADSIENKRLQLGKHSGFEKLYHKVTRLYFGGMVKHLLELQPFLKPGANLAYVVGDQASFFKIMIRTGQLLGTIAESVGYEWVRTDLFRTRFSTSTRSELNEEVVILRWPG